MHVKKIGKNVHWCWRYSTGRTTFSNILSIWANKNGNKSAIMNLIRTKLYRIYGTIVVNAFVICRESVKMFIGVGDIHPNGQHFQIFCQFEQTKMAIMGPFWIWSRRNSTRFIGGFMCRVSRRNVIDKRFVDVCSCLWMYNRVNKNWKK